VVITRQEQALETPRQALALGEIPPLVPVLDPAQQDLVMTEILPLIPVLVPAPQDLVTTEIQPLVLVWAEKGLHMAATLTHQKSNPLARARTQL
jgi:hypothetical protein